MKGLGQSFSELTWRRVSSILGLMTVLLAMGFFARLSYQQFLFLQAQTISGLSVFNEIIIPLAGLTLLLQIVMAILFAVQLLPTFHSLAQQGLVEQASVKPWRLLFALLRPIVTAAILPLIYFVIIVGVLSLQTDLDWARLVVTASGLLLIAVITSFVIFIVCCFSKRVLVALLVSIMTIATIIIIESGVWFWWSQISWHGIFNPFFRFREGVFVFADLVAYGGWLILVVIGGYLSLTRHLSFDKKWYLSGLTLAALLIAGSPFVAGQMDVTQNKRNSLSSSISEKLIKQKEPLKVIAVVNDETGHDEIIRGFEIIQRVYPNSELSFQSRQNFSPELQQQSEYLQFKLGELHQSVAYPFEQPAKIVFELAIEQMMRRKSQWITFIEGHGEASLFDKKTAGLSKLYNVLTQMGWPVAAQNLNQMPLVSDNTKLLVIASSKQQWLPKEVNLVIEYLKNGGNLFLLLDPDSFVPPAIEEYLGTSSLPGTLIDWNGYQSGTPHPAIVVVNQLSQHPVVNQLNSLLAFPWSSGLLVVATDENKNFNYETVIETHAGVWNELNADQEQMVFNQETEQQRAFPLAIAAVNQARNQKIMVIGDSHFISDSAINNYANKQFALNIISWLTNVDSQEQQLAQQRDKSLAPSRIGHFIFNWGFNLLVPALVLVVWLSLGFNRGRNVR